MFWGLSGVHPFSLWGLSAVYKIPLTRYGACMGTEPQPSAPLSKSRGLPGASVRARGMSRALSPFLVMIFIAGWVFGAIVSPSVLEGPASGMALILLAGGLLVTWNRAVLLMGRHEEGAQGEEVVARTLEGLPEDWRVFHSVPWQGKSLDHVVVGPENIFSIETIQWRGPIGLQDGALTHGDQLYPGYTLDALSSRAEHLADSLHVPENAVVPVVCMVEGRFTEAVGEHEGVWLTELQGMVPILLEDHGACLEPTQRVEVLSTLNEWLDEERAG